MLHIATMLGIASPLLLENRFIIAFRSWINMVLRVAAAFAAAATVYGLILLAIIKTYPSSGSMAIVVYGIGLAVAALLGIRVGTALAPERFARFTFMGTSALAVLLPLGLYVQMAIGGGWHAGYLWYLVGGVGGSVAAMRLMAEEHLTPRMSRV